MTNKEYLEKLTQIGWLDNLATHSEYEDFDIDHKHEIIHKLTNNEVTDNRYMLLAENAFDYKYLHQRFWECIENILQITGNDLTENELESLLLLPDDECYEVDELFEKINSYLLSKNILKGLYELPATDSVCFYVYKPIEVYQKALDLGLISKP